MTLNPQILQAWQKPEPYFQVVKVLLWVFCCYAVAKLIWVWVEAFSADYTISAPSRPMIQSATTASNRINVDAALNYHVFGDEAAKSEDVAVVVQPEATETRLPLKLRGIYAASEQDKANAIIEAAGKQEVYFIGDSITGGSGAKLHEVLATKVLLNRMGQLESLTLEQEDSAFEVESTARPIIAEQDSDREEDDPKQEDEDPSQVVDNPRIKRELGELKQQLMSDPTSLNDLMRWEPVMENGELQGVKISPGKARRLFFDLKLRRNDIVTSINGVSLTDPSQLLGLQQSLGDATEVNLSIIRNGQPQDLSIKLSDTQ